MEKRYETENLIIFWKPDICQHTGKCVHGAPKVLKWEESHGLFLRMGKKKIL